MLMRLAGYAVRALVVSALVVAGASGCRDALPRAVPADMPADRIPPHQAGQPAVPRWDAPAAEQMPAPSGQGFIGVVIAPAQASIAAGQEGEVVDIRVRIGDRVQPGDVLVRLDERPIREELAITRAELGAARAELARAGAELAEARDRLARRQALQSNVAQEELNAAGYAVAKATGTRDRARAAVAHQRARIARLERQLADARITAPFAAVVAMRHVDPGAVVQAGAPLVRLIAAGPHWVRFAVPAGQSTDLAPGDRVSVAIESLQPPVPAEVRQIAPELDPSSQMFLVEAALAPPAQQAARIRAGQAARVQP